MSKKSRVDELCEMIKDANHRFDLGLISKEELKEILLNVQLELELDEIGITTIESIEVPNLINTKEEISTDNLSSERKKRRKKNLSGLTPEELEIELNIRLEEAKKVLEAAKIEVDTLRRKDWSTWQQMKGFQSLHSLN